MKKMGMISAALVMCSVMSYGQVRFDLGLKGGLNFASLNSHSSVTQNYGSRTGYHLGAYALLKISKIGIQPEIILSRQGQSFSYSTQQNLSSNFDYINIPIMVKYYLLGGFNLQVGPQFGYLIGAKGDIITGTQTSATVSTGQNIKNYIKGSDLSLGFGFGWDLPLGINLTARYNLGLSDINKKTDQTAQNIVTSLGTVPANNRVIQVSIGYRLFKLGK